MQDDLTLYTANSLISSENVFKNITLSDFSKIDFSEINFGGINLNGVKFEDIDFTKVADEDLGSINWDTLNDTLLSSITQKFEVAVNEIDEVVNSITRGPRPYDLLVEHIFGKGHVFPEVLNIQVPENFEITSSLISVQTFLKNLDDDVFDIVTKNDTVDITDLDYVGFCTVVKGKKIINTPRVKAFIELIDLMQKVGDVINEENTEYVSRVIAYKAHEMCSY
jgi:hypothetical protein